MILRLTSHAAVLALCAAGSPALATDAPEVAGPSFNAALDEWRGAVRFWSAAREQAERAIAEHPAEPLVVDDLATALALGDGLSVPPQRPLTAARLHLAAVRLWAVISHCLNARLGSAHET